MDVKEEAILGSAAAKHWYYVSKGRALEAMLGNIQFERVMDVGAGAGVFAKRLLETDTCRSATCVDTAYPGDRDGEHVGKPIRFRREAWPAQENLLLMMDVLEHVDDDQGMLEGYAQKLISGGHVLITVPAFQELWSGHDVFLEHRRRYTLAQVESLVTGAGLEVVRSRYFFGLLLPAVAALRWWSRWQHSMARQAPRSALRVYPDWLNTLLIGIHASERITLFRFNRLAGLTVFCLARKPD